MALSPSEVRCFATGYCAEYAVALQEVVGGRLYAVRCHFPPADDFDEGPNYTIAHVFVSRDRGITGIDVYGRRQVAKILAATMCALGSTHLDVIPTSRADVDFEMGLEDEAIAAARNLVRQGLEAKL
jgi:hypothetical protein